MGNEKSAKLIYVSSRKIVEYITQHPIVWWHLELSKRGSCGDQAGQTPTPAVEEFISLFHDNNGLFTQDEYAQRCMGKWKEWLDKIGDAGKKTFRANGDEYDINCDAEKIRWGIKARLFNNFYVSMIDSLHVWAMLSETGEFDYCYMDSYKDAVSKTDLTLVRGNDEITVALVGPSRSARDDREYKISSRNKGQGVSCIEVQMQISRPRNPGNKRWYSINDFSRILSPIRAQKAQQSQSESEQEEYIRPMEMPMYYRNSM